MSASIFRGVVLLLLILLIGGCVSAPADPEAVDSPVNHEMLTAPVVTLRLMSVNGAEPPDGVVDTVVARLQPYMKGKIVVTVLNEMELELPPEGFGHVRVRSKQVPPSASEVMIVFLPVATFGRGVYTREHDGWQQIQLSAAHVERIAGPFISKRAAWELVMMHEFGHALGVPAAKERSWSELHCTAPHCVMYPKVDARSVLAAIVTLGPPTTFCNECDAELRNAAAAPPAVQETMNASRPQSLGR